MSDTGLSRRTFLGLPLLLAFAGPAQAQWQPTKPVRFVVPFAPGGLTDVVMRALSGPLTKALGQPVIVESRPGAGGNIATEVVARSAPDGHTFLLGTNGPLALSPLLIKDLRYDPEKDLAPVVVLGTAPNVIVVPASMRVTTLAQLAERARATPEGLNYGSFGVGSISHLTMEFFAHIAAVRMVHVPYAGIPAAVSALVAGDIHVLATVPSAVTAQVAAGQLVVIAQTGAHRSPLFPKVPTAVESGFEPLVAEVWNVIMAPARTPPAAIARLGDEIGKLARDPTLQESLWARLGMEPSGAAPEAVSELMRRERETWERVIREAGIVAQ